MRQDGVTPPIYQCAFPDHHKQGSVIDALVANISCSPGIAIKQEGTSPNESVPSIKVSLAGAQIPEKTYIDTRSFLYTETPTTVGPHGLRKRRIRAGFVTTESFNVINLTTTLAAIDAMVEASNGNVDVIVLEEEHNIFHGTTCATLPAGWWIH